jgi:CubicO group peptidase (beta-lactamase class C family)
MSFIHRSHLAALAAALLLGACAGFQPGRSIQIASAGVSQTLCSSVFISGRDADQTYREEKRSEGGMGLIDWALRYSVDRERREVSTTVAGAFASRAVYREGMGCLIDHAGIPPDVRPPREAVPVLLPEIAGPAVVPAADARLRAAIDEAFAEPAAPPWRYTKAVVVVHRGRVVGERYAPDIHQGTAWHGHSVSKSVTHALVGVLVRQGKLEPEPLDPLLRMSDGGPRIGFYTGFDDATRMWSFERDMAGFAASRGQEVPPGTRWAYSDPAYMLASRAVRDAAGGQAADVIRLAERELFGPLGMATAVMEFDATGTPVGASHFYASARDWARFGLLYLNDGVVGGRQILPPGWVKQAATPTLDTGYGAGFWLNNDAADTNPMGFPWGLPGAPADAYFGFGYLGQFLVIVPSRQLVIVRLGLTHVRGGDRDAAGRLVTGIVAAVDAR